MIRASNVFMCAALLAAGCATYTAKPIDPGAQQAALESRRLDAPELAGFIERATGRQPDAWPPRAWGLDPLTMAAFHFQPDLDRAQAQRRAAEAAAITAGKWPNPTAGLSFERNMDAPTGQSAWTRGFALGVPLETAGRRDIRIEQARQSAQAAHWREAEAVWQVRSRVRAALLAAYPIDEPLRLQRDLQQDIARIVERRFAAGLASQPDLTQARLTLDRAALALSENAQHAAESRARLAAVVGVPATALQGVKLDFDAFDRLPPVADLPSVELRRAALLSRADVLAALADYEVAQAALQREVARQYPDISLGPGYTWDAGQVKWSLGLSLVLPLFDRNEGPIAEAKARREAAAASFRAVQARAIAELDEALAGYGHALATVETADALLRGQRRTERAAAAAFRAGEADRLAWMSARYETAVGELAAIQARMRAQQSLGRVEDALHRPLAGGVPAFETERITSSRRQPSVESR